VSNKSKQIHIYDTEDNEYPLELFKPEFITEIKSDWSGRGFNHIVLGSMALKDSLIDENDYKGSGSDVKLNIGLQITHKINVDEINNLLTILKDNMGDLGKHIKLIYPSEKIDMGGHLISGPVISPPSGGSISECIKQVRSKK